MNTVIGSHPNSRSRTDLGIFILVRDRLLLDVTNKSSLDLYQYFYTKQGKQVYLDNQNDFKASRLKLLARTKTIPLQKYLCRMNLSGEMATSKRSLSLVIELYLRLKFWLVGLEPMHIDCISLSSKT
jgi:hypothetical protein